MAVTRYVDKPEERFRVVNKYCILVICEVFKVKILLRDFIEPLLDKVMTHWNTRA